MIGKVENVEYTSGGLGNQWTTIDGAKYATWWDIRTIDWKVGDRVEHKPYTAPGWNGATVPATRILRRVDS